MSQSLNSTAYALNSVAAAGADATLANGILTLTGGFQFPYNSIEIGTVAINPAVAAVGRVTTLTCAAPAAVGEEYSVSIQQFQADGAVFNQFIAVNSVVGSTATSMATLLNAAINAYITSGQLIGTSSSAAAVVTTTGGAAAPMLRIVGNTSNVAVAVTTGGTPAVNSNVQLIGLDATNYVSTNTYTVLQFNYATDVNTINGDKGVQTFYYLINAGDADAAALVTKLTEIFNGIIPGGTAANPEAIALA